mmetsp:Transcript_44171/g.142421  ORF Transcript_44171/g.142421 Transcript_44171/m.142421 type:complete len:368 (+) Transcript_44171:463-1566(+)
MGAEPDREPLSVLWQLEARLEQQHRAIVAHMPDDAADRLVHGAHGLLVVPLVPAQPARRMPPANVQVLALERDLWVVDRRQRQASDHDRTARRVRKVDPLRKPAAADGEEDGAAHAGPLGNGDVLLESLDHRCHLCLSARLDDDTLVLFEPLEHGRPSIAPALAPLLGGATQCGHRGEEDEHSLRHKSRYVDERVAQLGLVLRRLAVRELRGELDAARTGGHHADKDLLRANDVRVLEPVREGDAELRCKGAERRQRARGEQDRPHSASHERPHSHARVLAPVPQHAPCALGRCRSPPPGGARELGRLGDTHAVGGRLGSRAKDDAQQVGKAAEVVGRGAPPGGLHELLARVVAHGNDRVARLGGDV